VNRPDEIGIPFQRINEGMNREGYIEEKRIEIRRRTTGVLMIEQED
jgi:hypothetical protein